MNKGVRKLNYNKLQAGISAMLVSLLFFSCNTITEQSNTETTDTVVISDTLPKASESQKNDDTEHDITKPTETVTISDKEYTAKYICPNHCKNSGNAQPGECNECGMELIENPIKQKEENK